MGCLPVITPEVYQTFEKHEVVNTIESLVPEVSKTFNGLNHEVVMTIELLRVASREGHEEAMTQTRGFEPPTPTERQRHGSRGWRMARARARAQADSWSVAFSCWTPHNGWWSFWLPLNNLF